MFLLGIFVGVFWVFFVCFFFFCISFPCSKNMIVPVFILFDLLVSFKPICLVTYCVKPDNHDITDVMDNFSLP